MSSWKKRVRPPASTQKASNQHAPSAAKKRPRILLVDLDLAIAKQMQSAGHSVETGSFGSVYSVTSAIRRYRVPLQELMPINFSEMEIVVVDLQRPTPITDQSARLDDTVDAPFIASPVLRTIDARPLGMSRYRDQFNRILESGGLFVLFAAPRYLVRVIDTRNPVSYAIREFDLEMSSWGFLSRLSAQHLSVNLEQGDEIETLGPLLQHRELNGHIEGAQYSCAFTPRYSAPETWVPLAKNKYGEVVGAIWRSKSSTGRIVLLPRPRSIGDFLVDSLRAFLPDESPHLFPEVRRNAWVTRPEYELPEVRKVDAQIFAIQRRAEAEVVPLVQERDKKHAEWAFMHDLLTASDDVLVGAVAKAFATLGFSRVEKVDDSLPKTGKPSQKVEDLRIGDLSPLLLIEVKGIKGMPSDSDCLQVQKYVAPRMKEHNRFDVRGLAIINAQRHLPPLDRDNDHVFREDILTNASAHDIGLMSTWDLFRILRDFNALGWKPEYVRDLFYKPGRVSRTPAHYVQVGIVTAVYARVGAVEIASTLVDLAQGQRIAFELQDEHQEQVLESLQMNGVAVTSAPAGGSIGIKIASSIAEIGNGTRVFVIRD